MYDGRLQATRKSTPMMGVVMKGLRYAALPIVLCLAVLSSTGCVMNRIDRSPQTLDLREGGDGIPVEVRIAAGDAWASRTQAGPFIFNVLPQFAVWAEDGNGEFLDTLYVTGADFKKLRHAEKQERGPDYFADTLPTWASRVVAAGKSLPSKESPYPDAVTAPTPAADVIINTAVPAGSDGLVFFLEINKSGDENEVFTKEANDSAGQPSLVYRVAIADPRTGTSRAMELLGHGGTLADEPGVYADLSHFDTALQLIDGAVVRYR